MVRACTACGEQFESKGAWMRLCWRCWRRREDNKLEDAAYHRGYLDGLGDGGRNGRAGRGGLDDDLVRQLVTLCHPDRHPPERFELANRATATLLGMLNGNGRR